MDVRAVLAGLTVAGVGLAWGSEPAAPAPTRLRCHTFETTPGSEIDTRDASTELGRWVLALEDQGWQVREVEFEVGAKPTGYTQGWSHVCMEPVPR